MINSNAITFHSLEKRSNTNIDKKYILNDGLTAIDSYITQYIKNNNDIKSAIHEILSYIFDGKDNDFTKINNCHLLREACKSKYAWTSLSRGGHYVLAYLAKKLSPDSFDNKKVNLVKIKSIIKGFFNNQNQITLSDDDLRTIKLNDNGDMEFTHKDYNFRHIDNGYELNKIIELNKTDRSVANHLNRGFISYFSKNGTKDNHNEKAKDMNGDLIVCRHLAFEVLRSERNGNKNKYYQIYSNLNSISSHSTLKENIFDKNQVVHRADSIDSFEIKDFTTHLYQQCKLMLGFRINITENMPKEIDFEHFDVVIYNNELYYKHILTGKIEKLVLSNFQENITIENIDELNEYLNDNYLNNEQGSNIGLSTPIDNERYRSMSFMSPNHAMAITLKRKKNDNRIIIKFYDPNKTSSHCRFICHNLNKINQLKLEDFLTSDELSAYFPSFKQPVGNFLIYKDPNNLNKINNRFISSDEREYLDITGGRKLVKSIIQNIDNNPDTAWKSLVCKNEYKTQKETFKDGLVTIPENGISGFMATLVYGNTNHVAKIFKFISSKLIYESEKKDVIALLNSQCGYSKITGIHYLMSTGDVDNLKIFLEFIMKFLQEGYFTNQEVFEMLDSRDELKQSGIMSAITNYNPEILNLFMTYSLDLFQQKLITKEQLWLLLKSPTNRYPINKMIAHPRQSAMRYQKEKTREIFNENFKRIKSACELPTDFEIGYM